MPTQLSAGVISREFDLTTIVPRVSTTTGALAGVFRWGPVDERVTISDENVLVKRMGKPTNFNPETWFVGASFLGYTNHLVLSRAADVTGNNITASYESSNGEFSIESSNNVLLLSNTEGISEGMVLFAANTNGLPLGAKVSSVNTTAVVLADSATANVTDVEVMFREDIVYTAVAQQSDIDYDAFDISDWDNQIIKNKAHYESLEANGHQFDSSVLFVARYPGEIGNSLRVSVCDSPSQFRSNTVLAPNATFSNTSALTGTVGSNTLTLTITPANTANANAVSAANTLANDFKTSLSVGDLVEVGNTRIGFQFLQVTGISNVTSFSNSFSFQITCDDEVKLSTNTNNSYLTRYWEFYNAVEVAPEQSDYVLAFGNTSANDELHIVVVDEGGKFTGSPGEILEVYRNLSRATDAKSADGATIYYKEVVNQKSEYVWFANDRTTARSNTAAFVTSSTAATPLNMRMIGGADGPDEADVSFGTLAFAWDLFKNKEEGDISLVMQGKARGEAVSNFTQLGNYLIDNITEHRQDCLAFISPDYHDVVNNRYGEAESIVQFRNSLRSSSWGVLDSGYKYMFDKYNSVYRWVPLNGDVAGLCARTDMTNDAWWSPAGFNRGHIRNVVRVAFNPGQTDRDILYKNGINPVVTFPGKGTVLYGDKTLLAKPSAFDRINVRRLFIVLRKAISEAARFTLFEFNDDFTRAQFRNMVNPYLRDIKGRRGITDFLVVCDASNNPGEIVDRNEFIGDIYIKPARSINFIQLNFVAVRTDVSFSEIVGRFG